MLEPAILLLDEPLSALDPNLRKQVRAELKSLQRRTGVTFIFVTHDQEEALSMSDTIALLNKGRLEQVGTPQQLYLQPDTRFVAGFLGAVNWLGPVGVRPEATRISRQKPGFGRARQRCRDPGRNVPGKLGTRRGEVDKRRNRGVRVLTVGTALRARRERSRLVASR